MRHYLAAMGRYASFAGRASRAEFWWFTAVLLVLSVVVVVGADAAFGTDSEEARGLYALFLLAHALPGFAVTVRRLHDSDRSGWWVLINLTGIGSVVGFVFMALPGTEGPNRFGPEPGHEDEGGWGGHGFDRPGGSGHPRGERRAGQQGGTRPGRRIEPTYGGGHDRAEPSFEAAAPDSLDEELWSALASSAPPLDLRTGDPARAHRGPQASDAGVNGIIADLERLAALRASGDLSEAEFTVMKAAALSRGGGR